MVAVKEDLIIEQGATWTVEITWNGTNGAPKDLSGYTARMKAKQTYDSTAVISLTNGSGITLGSSTNNIVITLSATATAALSSEYALLYDLELETGGVVTRLLQGKINISREVSK